MIRDFIIWQAIVQMSVQFAQQTELVRLNKRACQKSSSMQTMQPGKDEMQEMANEELTPRASPSLSSWLEEVERLKRELEERNIVIRMLKKELQTIQSGPEQVCVTKCCAPYLIYNLLKITWFVITFQVQVLNICIYNNNWMDACVAFCAIKKICM